MNCNDCPYSNGDGESAICCLPPGSFCAFED